MVQREFSTRTIRAVVLEQTNANITNRVAEISVEFTAKEAAARRLMEPNGEPPGSLKGRPRVMPATPPGVRTGDVVKRRLKQRRWQRGPLSDGS
jgi:hypothetical protein